MERENTENCPGETDRKDATVMLAWGFTGESSDSTSCAKCSETSFYFFQADAASNNSQLLTVNEKLTFR